MKTFVTNVRLWLLALTLLAGMASCKKDNDPDPVNNEPAFVGKRWKMTAMDVTPVVDIDGDGTDDPDLYVLLEECEKDDITIFQSNGKISGEEGEVCAGQEPTTSTGTWVYNKDTKMLSITDNDGTETGEVIETSGSTLKTKFTAVEDGITVTLTITWKAQ